MCTVTYIPNNNGFLLTSNRDEKITRSIAIQPEKYELDGQQIIFPKDPDAGGTWIALHENSNAFCLLNGGFGSYVHGPQFNLSRGKVLLEIAKAQNALDIFISMELSACAPFTLVIVAMGLLYEARWDGTKKHLTHLNENEPHIWSSATLYTKEQQKLRADWFAQWLKTRQTFSSYDLFQFHQFTGDADEATNLVMAKNNIYKTVSITCIQASQENYSLEHLDLNTHTNKIVGFKNQNSFV